MRKLFVNAVSDIKNASQLGKTCLVIKSNKFVFSLLKALYKEGVIQSYFIKEDKKKIPLIEVHLRSRSNIQFKEKNTARGRKTLYSLKDICTLSEKNKILFFSTPKGILTSYSCKQNRVGGIFILKF